MREIKFRGMEQYGTWRYGFYYVEAVDVDALGFDYVSFIKEEYGDHYRDFDVKKETVGQFTGLKDKNGVEIYEGDIVHVEYDKWSWESTVEWDTVNPCFVLANLKKGQFPEHEYDFNKCDQMQIEVIGNIHQNPELITP